MYYNLITVGNSEHFSAFICTGFGIVSRPLIEITVMSFNFVLEPEFNRWE